MHYRNGNWNDYSTGLFRIRPQFMMTTKLCQPVAAILDETKKERQARVKEEVIGMLGKSFCLTGDQSWNILPIAKQLKSCEKYHGSSGYP